MFIQNRHGQLYEETCNDDNIEADEVKQFQLVRDAPTLMWDMNMDNDYRITTDGKIYSVWKNKILDTEEAGFKQVINTFVPSKGFHIHALLEDGTLMGYNVDDDIVIHKGIIDRNVAFITLYNTIYISKINGELSVDLGEYGEVIGAYEGVLITDTHILSMNRHNEWFRIIERIGNLLGISLVKIKLDDIDNGISAHLIVEINDDQLKIGLYDMWDNHCDEWYERRYIINEFMNTLTAMHNQSPFIDMIIYDRNTHLLNQEGELIQIKSLSEIGKSNIPGYIFSNNMVKNARNRIDN